MRSFSYSFKTLIEKNILVYTLISPFLASKTNSFRDMNIREKTLMHRDVIYVIRYNIRNKNVQKYF